MRSVPVVIAGAGPVGMTLARVIARLGVRGMLVERNPTTTRHPKMDITNNRSMELFARFGLAEALRAVAVPTANNFDVGTVRNFVWDHDDQVAMKRSSKRMANCALAARFKTRNSSFSTASSVGKWPRARTARRSLAFKGLDGVCNRYVGRGACLVRLGWPWCSDVWCDHPGRGAPGARRVGRPMYMMS
jgi:hypothetical protein